MPARDGISRQIAFRVEVLPAPLAPIRHTSSPSSTAKSIPLTARMPPYWTSSPLASSSTLRPQIGFDDLGVALHLRRRALSDLFSVIQHQHAVADLHHQAHVMLDEQHGDAVTSDCLNELAQGKRFRCVHAGGRLVERKQLRLGGESARDLEASLVAVRQAARGVVGAAADPDIVEQLGRARFDLFFFLYRLSVSEHCADDAGMAAQVTADHHVLERRQVGEQADVLERARNACGGYLVRLQAGQVAPVEQERAGVWRVKPRQHVEERGLAGAVRTDQPENFAAADGKRDLGKRLQAAEALGDAVGLQKRHAACPMSSRFLTAEGSRPAGRNSITSARPKISMRITSGSISWRPNSASCSGSTVQRRISGTNDSSSAPRITPQTLPMPPSTTIETTMIDSTSTKLSGEMKACMAENMPPASPPKLAPMAKASSFTLRVLMPIAAAAISSSRIASQARPIREFCSRRLMTITAMTTASSR